MINSHDGELFSVVFGRMQKLGYANKITKIDIFQTDDVPQQFMGLRTVFSESGS